MADLLGAASLLLAVVGILYGVWYSEIMQALETTVPKFTEDRAKPRRRVSNILFSRAVPLAIAASLVAMVFSPNAFNIAMASLRIYSETGVLAGLSSYDAVRTAFFVVVLLGWFLTAHSLLFVGRLVRLRRNLR